MSSHSHLQCPVQVVHHHNARPLPRHLLLKLPDGVGHAPLSGRPVTQRNDKLLEQS